MKNTPYTTWKISTHSELQIISLGKSRVNIARVDQCYMFDFILSLIWIQEVSSDRSSQREQKQIMMFQIMRCKGGKDVI